MKFEPLDSAKFALNEKDLKKWAYNTAVFLAPALLVALLIFQGGGNLREALVALKLWGLNVSIDLVKKFVADNK